MHVRSSGFDPDRPEADHPHQGRTHHPCMGQRSRVIGRSIATHLSHKTKAFRDTPNGPRAARRSRGFPAPNLSRKHVLPQSVFALPLLAVIEAEWRCETSRVHTGQHQKPRREVAG